MSDKDQKIRKHWLIMLGLSALITIVNTFVQLQSDSSLDAIPQVRYGFIAFSSLVALGVGFIAYHCVYRKFGTKLLIFCLIATIASLVANSILYLSGKLDPFALDPYHGAFALMGQGVGILWIVACWRMLKLNKRLQVLKSSA